MSINLKLYDNLSGEYKHLIDRSRPIRVFNCGPTVSDFIHVGHFRNALLVDVLMRTLVEFGFKNVMYLSNVSNISLKIYNRSIKEKERSWSDLGLYFMHQWIKDLSRCNIITPNVIVPDTNHVDSIIEFVQKLLDVGVAYETENAVYYKINYLHESIKKYVSDKNLSLIKAIEDNSDDIVIWEKVFDKNDDMVWDSPWGKGRPGKHIPCSDVIEQYCTEDDFLIHCAGNDLYYHHSCEISHNIIGKNNAKVADVWLYNSLVNIGEQKMGKSLGNSVSIRELLTDFEPDDIRWYLLSNEFGSIINFSKDVLLEYATDWKKIKSKILKSNKLVRKVCDFEYYNNVISQLADNLNVSSAINLINSYTINSNDSSILNTSYYLLDMLVFEMQTN